VFVLVTGTLAPPVTVLNQGGSDGLVVAIAGGWAIGILLLVGHRGAIVVG
jgi:hypothetical protein